MFYEIKKKDIGREVLASPRGIICLSPIMGRVMPGDVGKRIHLRGGVYQVESNDQRDARVKKGV